MLTYKLTDDNVMNKKSLFLWTINLHNIVNLSLGKNMLSEEDVINKYIHKNKTDKKNIIIIILLILIIVLLVILMKKQ
jgi:predicted nucleic acid-binding Zn ribbon protein